MEPYLNDIMINYDAVCYNEPAKHNTTSIAGKCKEGMQDDLQCSLIYVLFYTDEWVEFTTVI